ncbi:MAG: acyl carrier protein [Proteobacteria bacterium]|nr:MAG: acyl carrier protein [Pseudomonadota bacterium]
MEKDANKAVYAGLIKFKASLANARDDQKLVSELGLESIDIVDLLFEVEQMTGVTVELSELLNFTRSQSQKRFQDLTIRDIASYIDAKRA